MSNIEKNISLRCDVCGADDKFEFNEDKSYVKCTNCGKEYFGGYDELVEYNQDNIDNAIEDMKTEVVEYAQKYLNDSLRKAFAGNKYIKLK